MGWSSSFGEPGQRTYEPEMFLESPLAWLRRCRRKKSAVPTSQTAKPTSANTTDEAAFCVSVGSTNVCCGPSETRHSRRPMGAARALAETLGSSQRTKRWLATVWPTTWWIFGMRKSAGGTDRGARGASNPNVCSWVSVPERPSGRWMSKPPLGR